jgi:hypothetical protein
MFLNLHVFKNDSGFQVNIDDAIKNLDSILTLFLFLRLNAFLLYS